MELDNLIRLLRSGNCNGCPAFDECDNSEEGCVLMGKAADALEYLQQELVNLGKSAAAEKQACFRLGQMDMRESAVTALREAADGTQGITCAALLAAADLIMGLEVAGRAEG